MYGMTALSQRARALGEARKGLEGPKEWARRAPKIKTNERKEKRKQKREKRRENRREKRNKAQM